MTDKAITDLARSIHAFHEKAITIMKRDVAPEIDWVVRTKQKDFMAIERILDILLNLAFDAEILRLFKKLCRYYFTINPQATAEYIDMYRELWDSDGG